MAPELCCPNCGNNDKTMLTPWMEPISQIPEEAEKQTAMGKKWYCECCGKPWVIQERRGGPNG